MFVDDSRDATNTIKRFDWEIKSCKVGHVVMADVVEVGTYA